MLVSTCRTGTGSFRKFVGGLSDARWKIVESAADDIGMCSLVWRRGVSGAVLCKAKVRYSGLARDPPPFRKFYRRLVAAR